MAKKRATILVSTDAETAADLAVLLLPATAKKHHRFIMKYGVCVLGRVYSATEMSGHEGERAFVQLDPADTGTAFCHLESGKFLCRAIAAGGAQ